ncbi:phosphogluconate dehydrogenase (NAD(+)-dependent, decarboxylating) [Lysinibacillus telephonicus]|uniref:Decarboxylating 6-phosphogluconate dehydrogenase n=1 Tax=Lysinibacillus telephonicus TaxID=1714840 RepID=A0A431UX87_9BACI|nr:decarboxylating 6-phosphogluconate dehydrogenase [Lysinibacillus telephonicus]RTQ96131.1 decarboxylating 6-phosphogluconate dehydrogenase [Lysinibacillus telephonicus]
MKIGIVGLGRMGFNLACNMLENNIDVVGYDIDHSIMDKIQCNSLFKKRNFMFFHSLVEFVESLSPTDALFLLVPHGEETEKMLEELLNNLPKNIIVIEAGNSHYKNSQYWYKRYKEKGIYFLDCGTSGGLKGARHGLCSMIGGDKEAFDRIEPILKKISSENGYLYTGPAGSGHFLKMIHNGIEYGMMQAIAEGFEILHESEFEYSYKEVATLWNSSSVIKSWLMELMINVFSEDQSLENISGEMHASGEAKWTIETALDLNVPAPVIALSLMMRNRSLRHDTFAGKVVASLRHQFGGHAVVKKANFKEGE